MSLVYSRLYRVLRLGAVVVVAVALPLRALLTAQGASVVAPAARAQLPSQLSDSAFWMLVTDISEPGGYFRITDNFTSNEMEIGRVFSMLRAEGVSGGVYLGVGPEQNFTYIAAIRPKMAFIVDIRRQAVVQHLMFKAMFEMAAERADFITLLFAKPRPAGIDSTTSIQELWARYRDVATDAALGARAIARVEERLTKTHGFTLAPEELDQLRSVMEAFQYYGPAITTRGAPGGFGGGGNNAGFVGMTGFSLDSSGVPQSFLSTEENYRYVKRLHELNLIVPVSGDFAGPKAVRAIGAWLRERGATVTAYYVSNVEQYLFQDGKADAFYANVATLPVTERSVFIRPYGLRPSGGGRFSFVIVRAPDGTQRIEGRSDSTRVTDATRRTLCPIQSFLSGALAGRVRSNFEALVCAP